MMPTTSRGVSRVLRLTVPLWLAISALGAQPQPANDSARAFVTRELRYLGLDDRLSESDLQTLVTLRVRTQDSSDKASAIAAYKDFWTRVSKLHGPATASPTRDRILEDMATRLVNRGPPTGEAWTMKATRLGQAGKVVKRGRGPIPMILIPPIGYDEIVYAEFMERNASRYTMHVITPPGFGGTPPPPRPERLELQSSQWWRGFENAVLRYMETARIDGPVIVGMTSAVFPAARLAIEHPGRFRAAVLLNGMLASPMSSPANRALPANRQEREAIAKRRFNFGLGMHLTGGFGRRNPEATDRFLDTVSSQTLTNVALQNTRNEAAARTLYRHMRLESHPEASYGYTLELLGSDLTGDIQRLRVPTLVIPSMSDDLLPASTLNRTNIVQFEEASARHPEAPLTIVPFYDTRMFATHDSPADLDRAIDDFVNGRPVTERPRRLLRPQASPRAEVHAALDTGVVSIQFSRPAARGRAIWGQTVPFDSLWRAGANESTTITLPVNALVQGQPLQRGTYSVFVIPRRTEWTVIFNRIVHQLGTFNYNPEFDALRVQVTLREIAPREWLYYSLDPLPDGGVEMSIGWSNLEGPIRISVAR